MRVTTLEVENFRCFERESFAFEESVTMLIGANGTGKSTLLDALRLGLGHSLRRLIGRAPTLMETDVRLHRYRQGFAVHDEPQYPVSVDLRGEIDGLGFRNAHSIFDLPSRAVDDEDSSTPLLEAMMDDLRAGAPRTIPLVVAYGTDRTERKPRKPAAKKRPSRTDGYASSLDEWFHGFRRCSRRGRGWGGRVGG